MSKFIFDTQKYPVGLWFVPATITLNHFIHKSVSNNVLDGGYFNSVSTNAATKDVAFVRF